MKIKRMTEVSEYGWRTSLYTGVDKVKTILFPKLKRRVLTNQAGGSAYIIPLKDVFYLVEMQDWEKVKKGWAIPKRLFKKSVDKNLDIFHLDLLALPTVYYDFFWEEYSNEEIIDDYDNYGFQPIEGVDVLTRYNIDAVKEYFKFFKISSKKFDYSYHPDVGYKDITNVMYKKIIEHVEKHALWLDFGEILLPEINKSLLLRYDKVLPLPFKLKHPIKKVISRTSMDMLNYLTYNIPFPPKREIEEA